MHAHGLSDLIQLLGYVPEALFVVVGVVVGIVAKGLARWLVLAGAVIYSGLWLVAAVAGPRLGVAFISVTAVVGMGLFAAGLVVAALQSRRVDAPEVRG